VLLPERVQIFAPTALLIPIPFSSTSFQSVITGGFDVRRNIKLS
jgi:hypothetical protein